MIEQHSIQAQSKKLTTFQNGVFAFIILAVITLVFCQITITKLEALSNDLFRELNRFAIAIQDSAGLANGDTQEAYSKYQDELEKAQQDIPFLTRRMVKASTLPPPDFENSLQMDHYRVIFRQYAADLRRNEDRVISMIIHLIYILLALILVFVIAVFYLSERVQKSYRRFSEVIKKGIALIESHLNFESGDSLTIPDSAPEEIVSFSETVNRIDTDIGLDQYLESLDSYGKVLESLSLLAPLIKPLLPFDRLSFAFIDGNGRITAEAAHADYDTIHLDPGFSEDIIVTSLASVINRGLPRIINDLEAHAAHHKISESTVLLMREGIQSSITVPLFSQERCVGFLFFSSREKHIYTEEHAKSANRVANKLKIRFYYEYLSQEMIAETANSFVGLMNEKDNETSNHLLRMSQYCFIITRRLSFKDYTLPPGFAREILWFAPLHDIGKIGIPDSILLKPGPLTDEEMAVMKTHVTIGERVIKGMSRRLHEIVDKPMMDIALDIIRGHHEKFNGLGYPAGLKGREIPLAGRIVAIADVFDALTSERPYKRAFSIEEALNIMTGEMKESFDPYLMDVFVEAMDEILEVYEKYKDV